MATTFDPVGAFQRGRRGAQQIEAGNLDIARERAAIPVRNQLSNLKLQQAQQTLGSTAATQAQQATTFDQKQALQKATILGQAAEALKLIPPNQHPQALLSMEPLFEKFGIPRGTFKPEDITIENLDSVIAQSQAFIGSGGDPSALDVAKTEKIQAETAQIGVPKVITVSDKEKAETKLLLARAAEVRNKVSGGGGLSPADAKILEEERKATVKSNVKRIATLQQSDKSRASAKTKAQGFLDLLQSGERESGTTRTILGFIPGVFSDQASFDEQFNSFAEVAAREKLKATGEIRPTDADVAGMKRALFGVGRDEATNIQLLQEFIQEQENLDLELANLRASKKSGTLGEFAGEPVAPPGGTPTTPPSGRQGGTLMTDAQGNKAFVFPDGSIEEVQ